MSSLKDKGPNFTFNREQVLLLIHLYEQHPILYMVSNEQYKNKSKRLSAFKKIQEEFAREFGTINLSWEDIRKKINSLRTQFFGELNKVKKSLVSGAGSEDIYTPTLWCFDLLKFVDTGNPTRVGESPLEIKISEVREVDEEMLFDRTVDELNSSFPSSPITSPTMLSRPTSSTSNILYEESPKKRRRPEAKGVSSKAEELIDRATHYLENTSVEPKEYDTVEAFCLSMCAELKQIKNRRKLRNLRKSILDLIYKAQEEESDEEK